MQIDFKASAEEVSIQKLRSIYRNFFLSHEGKFVLDDLMRKSKMLMPVYTNNSSDLLFIEGMRAMFCHIASYLVDEEMVDIKVQDYDPFDKKD